MKQRDCEFIRMGRRISRRKDKNGRRRYCLSYFIGRERHRIFSQTREGLTAKVLELMRKAREGAVDPQDVTLRQYATEWLERIETRGYQRSTVVSYRASLEKHILPFVVSMRQLGDFLLRDISVAHVRALIEAKASEGYKQDTVRLMKAALSVLMSDAVEAQLIPVNPCGQLAKRRGRFAPTDKVRPLTRDELARFLDDAKNEGAEGLVLSLIGRAGARPSEVLALTVGDFDLTAKTMSISKARPIGCETREGTKTGKSRIVNLPASIIPWLRSHIDAIPGCALTARCRSSRRWTGSMSSGFSRGYAAAARSRGIGHTI